MVVLMRLSTRLFLLPCFEAVTNVNKFTEITNEVKGSDLKFQGSVPGSGVWLGAWN